MKCIVFGALSRRIKSMKMNPYFKVGASGSKTLTTLVLASGVFALPLMGQNLALNPGIENGTGSDADNWIEISAPGPTAMAAVQRVATDANSGTYSMYLESVGGTDAGANAEMQQATSAGTAVAGATYDLSFFVKGSGGVSTVVEYEVQWLDSDGSDGGGVKGSTGAIDITTSVTAAYTQITAPGLTPAADSDAALIAIRAKVGAVTTDTTAVYVDDVAFQPNPALALPFNGGFELDDTSAADAAQWNEVSGATTTTTRSTIDPASGTASAYMTVDNTGTPAADPAFIDQTSPTYLVDDSATYDLTFESKVDSTDFTGIDIFAQVQWLDNSPGGVGFLGQTLQSLIAFGPGLTTNYQTFTLSGLTPPAGANTVTIRFQLSPGPVQDIVNGFYVDDVSLTSQGSVTPDQLTVCIEQGTVLSWTPTAGNLYQPQESSDGTNWVDIGSQIMGGAVSSLFEAEAAEFYRVQEQSTVIFNDAQNGGFEDGVAADADSWGEVGSQQPERFDGDARTGTYSMRILSQNDLLGSPNTSEVQQNVSAAGGLVPLDGSSYDLSFWAKKVDLGAISGVSYVQRYKLSWLMPDPQLPIDAFPFTDFQGGDGEWVKITATDLVPPTGTEGAFIQIFGNTGAVADVEAAGGVLIDDVELIVTEPGFSEPTTVASSTAAGVQLSWETSNGTSYDVTSSADLTSFPTTEASVMGDGSTATYHEAIVDAAKFFQVVEN
ncbi:MAG: hypothetical protein AAGC74_04495 [Verrucomicrobiota bacterium]